MNSKLRALIVVLLLIGSFTIAETWTPLTDQDALNYIRNVDQSQLILDIQRLDFLENHSPVIPDPWYTAALLENGTLIIFPTKHNLTANHGHLIYGIKFRTYTIPEFLPPKKVRWPFIALAIVTISTGIVMTIRWMAGK